MGQVSIVIPTYNRARYLRECIVSVLNQRGTAAKEVIVIDDGSTDNTHKVIKPFLSKIIYKRIRHSGLPAVARNVGLRIATSEFVAFQDSDDIWLPDKLASQLPYFNDSEVHLVYGKVSSHYRGKTRDSHRAPEPSRHPRGTVFNELLQENFISTLTVVARLKSLKSVGLFSERKSLRAVEDYHLWLRLAANHKVAFCNKVLAQYRVHNENISRVDGGQALALQVNVMRSLLRSKCLNHIQKNAARERLLDLYSYQLESPTSSHHTVALKRHYHKLRLKR